jgi:2'-5' RNA ligase
MPRPPNPQTAVIVVVPEAEPSVGALRARFDPSAALGVPAHVTLLHPFMAPDAIDAAVRDRLAAIAAASAPFGFRLDAIGRFPETLYLAPEPAAPFVALTRALVAAFPAWLPYEGRHPTVVPHLTVAQTDPSRLDSIESELRDAKDQDAITAHCTDIVLIENASGQWNTMHTFLLGSRTADSNAAAHQKGPIAERLMKNGDEHGNADPCLAPPDALEGPQRSIG